MSASLIIAQYDEDVSWINKIKYGYITKIYLYTKNSNNITPIIHSNIPIYRTYLPNIGREGHTYLYHIVHNYHNLSDMNIFVQGTPCIDVEIFNKDIDDLSYKNINLSHMNTIALHENNKISTWRNQPLETVSEDFFEWYNLYIDPEPINPLYLIYFQANFAVKKQDIYSRNRFYYQNIMNQLNTNNPEVGHFLERCWYYIFYGQSLSKLGV